MTAALTDPERGAHWTEGQKAKKQCHPGSFSNISNSAGDHRFLTCLKFRFWLLLLGCGRYVIFMPLTKCEPNSVQISSAGA
jgi:hypothetical protein